LRPELATAELYTLSLHDALPIWDQGQAAVGADVDGQALDPNLVTHVRALASAETEVNAAAAGPHLVGRVAALAEYTSVSADARRSEEHTSELQSRGHLVCRLLLE